MEIRIINRPENAPVVIGDKLYHIYDHFIHEEKAYAVLLEDHPEGHGAVDILVMNIIDKELVAITPDEYNAAYALACRFLSQ